jgi:4-hydroxy-tetrahydrodipicolinate synthase
MTPKHQFKGLSVALATPFNQDGEVDFDAWVKFIDFQIKNGVDHLVVCGTTGESPTVSDDEYARLIEVAVGTAKGRVQIVAGAGTNDTQHSIERSLIARDAGANGLLIVGPYYNKPPQRGLIAHYTRIADTVNMPIIVYNVPGRTGSNLLPESMAILAAHPHISAIKEASGDMNQILKVMAAVPSHTTILAGDDSMTLPVIAAGGQGVISVAGNVYPGKMSQFVRFCLDGNWTNARELSTVLLPFFNAMFVESNPIPVKAALASKGLMENVLRLPLVPLDEMYWPDIQRIMNDIDSHN